MSRNILEKNQRTPKNTSPERSPRVKARSTSKQVSPIGILRDRNAHVVPVRGINASNAQRNISEGQCALARAKAQIIRPGVKLAAKKDVPLYHADADDPKCIVRVLNGKSDRGEFVKGQFRKTSR